MLGWNFMLSGGLHGLPLILIHAWRRCFRLPDNNIAIRFLCRLLALLLVTLAWVPFRATDTQSVYLIWNGMLDLGGTEVVSVNLFHGWLEWIWLLTLLAAVTTTGHGVSVAPALAGMRLGLMMTAVLVLGALRLGRLFAHSEFLYFQF